MKMKKVMALCLTAVVGMGVLSGCGSTKSEFRQYAKCAEVKDYDGIEYVPTSREVTQDQIDEKINSFCTDNNVETKDYEHEADLRKAEGYRIECAEEFFKALQGW